MHLCLMRRENLFESNELDNLGAAAESKGTFNI